MNIADKLLMIAENELKVFEAGEKTERKKTDESLGGSVSSVEQAVDNILEAQDKIIEDSSVEDVVSKAYTEGITEGREVEKAFLWNELQINGTRVNYDYGFFKFPIPLFYPEHDINAKYSAESMFRLFGTVGTNATETLDLAQRLEECGKKLDVSQATFFNLFAYSSRISRFPEIDTTGCAPTGLDLKQAFMGCNFLETIDKLKLKDDGSQSFTSSFQNCTALKNLIVEGMIGNSINFSACPLSLESAISVIEHLKNLRDTAEEGNCTITFSDYTWGLLDADGIREHTLVDGSGITGTWQDLLTYMCWIS